MGLVFVTGVSGVGKSSVRRALVERGFEAHDTDEDGLTRWCDRVTGLPVEGPGRGRTREWLERHDWKICRERIEGLAALAVGRVVFLCGSPSNDGDVWDLFSSVICLVVDDATLRARLAERTTNEFGKAPHELEAVLRWNSDSEVRYRRLGATIVDGAMPLGEVVDAVVSAAG